MKKFPHVTLLRFLYIEVLEKEVKGRKYTQMCPQAPTRARARIFTGGVLDGVVIAGGYLRRRLLWDGMPIHHLERNADSDIRHEFQLSYEAARCGMPAKRCYRIGELAYE